MKKIASFRTTNISTSSSSSFSSSDLKKEFVYEDTLPMLIPSTLKERKRIFKELEVAFKAQVTTDELGHDKRAKKIHMNKPIPTVYNKHYSKSTKIKKQTRLGTDIYNASTTSDNGIHAAPFRSLKVEARGITYRQMSAIMANVKRRCEKEGWTREVLNSDTNSPSAGTYIRLTPDIVNMHDIERYVIGPYTQATGRSLVESLPSTAGTQSPRFFVVHTWSEKYENTMACIKTMIHDFSSNESTIDDERGGGMTIDTPIWIDAFALGRCQLNDETRKNSIATAMELANLRSVVILDRNGDVFSSIECLKQIEMSLCLSSSRRLSIDMDDGESRKGKSLSIYTSSKHSYKHPKYGKLSRKAIGLCQGKATIDANYTFHASIREHSFPTDRLKTINDLKVDGLRDVKDFLNSISPIEVVIPEEIDVFTCDECSIVSEISME